MTFGREDVAVLVGALPGALMSVGFMFAGLGVELALLLSAPVVALGSWLALDSVRAVHR